MKKSVKILIIILCLIIVGLVTFIVVDKIINISKKSNNENNNVVAEENNEKIEGNNIAEQNNVQQNTTTKNSTQVQNNTENQTQNKSTSVLSTQEALTIGNEMYKKAKNCYWNGVKYSENSSYDIDKNGSSYYKITNINEIKSVLVDEAFSDFLNKKLIKEKDGEYYIVAADRGGDISYLDNELKIDSITENKIEFTSIEKYCANEEDYGVYNSSNDVKDIITKEYKFVLVKESGKWKVSGFTLPD